MSDFKNYVFQLRSIRHDLETLIEDKINGSIADPIAVTKINDEEVAVCISKSSKIDEFNKEFDDLIEQLDKAVDGIERTQHVD